MTQQNLQPNDQPYVPQKRTKEAENGNRSVHRRRVLSAIIGYFDGRKRIASSESGSSDDSRAQYGVQGQLFGDGPVDCVEPAHVDDDAAILDAPPSGRPI